MQSPVDSRPVPGVRPLSAPLWLLVLITLSGTLAMHIFVPALPVVAQDLHAPASVIQNTVSLYILGLAMGQLIYGPLSDRFGRRPVLLAGVFVYTVAGVAAGLAPDPYSLAAARLFQALGGCAGLVLGRAVVRDLAGPEDATRRLALLNVAMMVGPGLGPAAGGLIAVHFGWRAIFALLAVLGAVIMVMTWRRLPETGPRDGTPDITALARNYRELLTSRRFLGFSIGGGCSTTSIYAFLASAPFFFVQELGRPVDEVGFYVASLIVGVSLGSALTSRIIQTVPLGALLIGFNLLSLVAGCVFLGMALTGTLTTTRLLVTMFFYALGAGVTSPAALAHAVSVNPRVIGSASGLYGFTQMTIGAICTTAAGLGHSTALATAIVLLVACAMGQASFWIAVRA